MTRREFLRLGGQTTAAALFAGSRLRAQGPFQPSWESLTAGYRCPDWFRDAKLGMWAHWSAQCVPEQGDWYARNMYIQGTPHYEHHLRTYGHPSRFGFKEIDHLWRAEHWDPERLVSLYQRAGAKYFVALANHHDNFDNYDSRFHAWNSVRIGPKKDLIGGWAAAARRRGLKFGVSNHSSHAWHWFQVAYGYDATGPMAGVRYDGFTATRERGAGQWWDGFDPQELYTGRHLVIPDGIRDIKAMQKWQDVNTRHWYETPPPDDPGFAVNWAARTNDLITRYHPDLLYFDDTGVPFGELGLGTVANLYNTSIAVNGSNQAVLNAKKLPPGQRAGIVEDYERGFSEEIQPHPWQTDTCIGAWHYKRDIKYKTVPEVAHLLVDIVSKNGNLLLNIPVRGDGTIDSREEAFIAGFTQWMDVHGEGIYATRPWRRYGEGPSRVAGGMFAERNARYTARDVRFTARENRIYAFLLGTPTENIRIQSLGRDQAPRIGSIALLGGDEALSWRQTESALEIRKPASFPSPTTSAFRITTSV
jgi:alpha-L-fucosidase